MDNLPTIAARVGKPTKPSAQNMLMTLADKYKEDKETFEQLGALYAYFMPPVPKAAKVEDTFKWVAQAVEKKGYREYLQYVRCCYNKDGLLVLVATDGHRMHVAKAPDGYTEGFYDVAGNKVDVDMYCPDWERVVPRENPHCGLYTPLKNPTLRQHGKNVLVSMPGDGWLNRAYLAQAMGKQESVSVSYEDGVAPYMISHECGAYAVIMPVRA